jgi:16S rRNA processing protein RimM
MGRVVAPHGVQGWIKVQPFTQEQKGLLGYSQWQVGHEGAWRTWPVVEARVHGAVVVAKLAGVDDRDQAAAFQGQRIAVARSEFPPAAGQEYYWADLAGLQVVNAEGVVLGKVLRLFETGANDVMVVQGDRERLLPFISTVIRSVDLAAGTISVDWSAEY